VDVVKVQQRKKQGEDKTTKIAFLFLPREKKEPEKGICRPMTGELQVIKHRKLQRQEMCSGLPHAAILKIDDDDDDDDDMS